MVQLKKEEASSFQSRLESILELLLIILMGLMISCKTNNEVCCTEEKKKKKKQLKHCWKNTFMKWKDWE